MEYKTNPLTLVVAVVITAFIVGGGVYFWQTKDVVPTAQPKIALPELPVTPNNYQNTKWNFSLDVPEGYAVSGEDASLLVTKKAAQGDETPLPEVTITISSGDVTTMGSSDSMSVIERTDVLINGVKGAKSVVSYSAYPTGNQCPIYRLTNNGILYEFSLYECLESEIFEPLVESFKIIK